MTYYEALQARALRAVLKPTGEDFLRHVKRFFSKTFHVPLPRVDDLSEEDILQAYYEEAFEQMSEDDREEYLDLLLETPEEREERERREAAMEDADSEFYAKLNEGVLKGETRGPPPETAKYKPKPPQVVLDAAAKAKAIRDRIKHGITNPEPLPPPLPDIHMSFGEPEGNLPEEWANLDPLGPPPKK